CVVVVMLMTAPISFLSLTGTTIAAIGARLCPLLLSLRIPFHELVEELPVAAELQRVQRNPAVQGEDQLMGRAFGRGIGAGPAEAVDPRAVGGEMVAPGAALGDVVVDD